MQCEILFSTCLAIKLLIWIVVAAAASGCFCRVLIVAPDSDLSVGPLFSHPLWVCSFLFFFSLRGPDMVQKVFGLREAKSGTETRELLRSGTNGHPRV